MARNWLDALLGAIFNSSVEIPISGGLNFKGRLTAVLNSVTGVIDVSLPDGSIDIPGLAVEASGYAVPFVLEAALPAAAAGTADDVTITLSTPVQFRIIDAWVRVSAAIGASTIQIRTAPGGGGSALLSPFDTGSTGVVRDSSTSNVTLSSGFPLYARRSDRAVAGRIYLLCVRT